MSGDWEDGGETNPCGWCAMGYAVAGKGVHIRRNEAYRCTNHAGCCDIDGIKRWASKAAEEWFFVDNPHYELLRLALIVAVESVVSPAQLGSSLTLGAVSCLDCLRDARHELFHSHKEAIMSKNSRHHTPEKKCFSCGHPFHSNVCEYFVESLVADCHCAVRSESREDEVPEVKDCNVAGIHCAYKFEADRMREAIAIHLNICDESCEPRCELLAALAASESSEEIAAPIESRARKAFKLNKLKT